MNDAEKKLAEELLKDITTVNASQRLEDYKLLLECVEKRKAIEFHTSLTDGLTPRSATATGIAAIDKAE